MSKNTKTRCEHCGASMARYAFQFGVLDCLLLLAMAQEVRKNIEKGLTFTEANRVHVPDLGTSNSIRCRTTIASKLGLIAKYKVDGFHAQGIWVITERGWSALRGEAVPAEVVVFRGEIQERSEKTITMRQAFHVHRAEVELAIARKSKIRSDHRAIADSYAPETWVRVAGYQAENK